MLKIEAAFIETNATAILSPVLSHFSKLNHVNRVARLAIVLRRLVELKSGMLASNLIHVMKHLFSSRRLSVETLLEHVVE
jgi:hypothetical protein